MHVQCSRRLASVDIRKVYAYVFRPLKSRTCTLFKQTSVKLTVKYISNCPNEFRLRPEQEASLVPPIFEPEVFRKQMYCIEECVCDIVGIFWLPRNHSAPLQYSSAPRVIRRPGNCTPLSLRYAPAD